MDRPTMEAFIRTSAQRGAVTWSRHAIERLVLHRATRVDVETALAACEIIEAYPDAHRALPDCLVLTSVRVNEPIHAVIAVDQLNNRIFVITVYRPDPARWSDDWKRRRV
jgi:uncharacterized protein DUF4258